MSLVEEGIKPTFGGHELTNPTGSRWFHRGMALSTSRGLSHLLQTICDDLYPSTPRLWNELINRRVLPSQGAAARRNLIEGILTRTDQPTLGIVGYPPERSIYDSFGYSASQAKVQDIPQGLACVVSR